jgi:asparagine synthase (glutamine-hydrolysing)
VTGVCAWAGCGVAGSDPKVVFEGMARRVSNWPDARTSGEARVAAAAGARGDPHRSTVAHDARWLAALVGTPEWRDEALGSVAHAQGHAAALREGYERHGARVLESMTGRSAGVVVREDGGEAFAFTDRLGLEPIAFAPVQGGIVIAANAAAIAAHPSYRGSIRNQAIFDYLYFHHVPAPVSVYDGVTRLLPGQSVLYRDGRTQVTRYWQPRFRERERTDFQRAREEFRSLLETVVARSVTQEAAGCFLSGGTDSSTVAGHLGRHLRRAAPTFSIGFEAEGYDEMSYARIAARHFGTDHHEYYVTPRDVLAMIPRIAAAYAEPFGNSSAVPTFYCAQLARSHGVRVLLAGDGGDELFGGNARYATQYVLSQYEHVPRWLRRGVLEPLLKTELDGPRLPLIGKLQSYVSQASIPMPARTETYNLLARLGIAELLEPDFLRGIDPREPSRLLEDWYAGVAAGKLINRQLGLDWKFTLADNDIPKVSTMCELAGVEVAYPLLREELVDFSLKLPPDWKLRRTQLRWFFKEALRDFLPPEIIAKTKHGFGLPFGAWVATLPELRAFAAESLDALGRRGIVREQALRTLWQERLPQHPPFYGGMIWLLLILEHWLRAREADARPAA